jgi:hypothetical protein
MPAIAESTWFVVVLGVVQGLCFLLYGGTYSTSYKNISPEHEARLIAMLLLSVVVIAAASGQSFSAPFTLEPIAAASAWLSLEHLVGHRYGRGIWCLLRLAQVRHQQKSVTEAALLPNRRLLSDACSVSAARFVRAAKPGR